MYKRLYVWVEGEDDRMFFDYVVRPMLEEKYDYIELTESGTHHASNIASRHKMIFTFLRDVLDVDTKTAQIDACKIEHVLSNNTLKKMTDFVDRFVKHENKDYQPE